MKFWKTAAFSAGAALLLLLTGCGGRQADAGVLFREAESAAEAMKSCEAAFSDSLVFTADGKRHSFRSSGKLTYAAEPFALHAVRTSQSDGLSGRSESYTVTENGGLWFYNRGAEGWEKADAQGLDTSPLAQIDLLGLLKSAEEEKYVRGTELDSRRVHKIELKLKNEALRGAVENIVTASGLGAGSRTIVQTLLDGAPPVYAYAYIDEESGTLSRLELDAAGTLDRVFQNIDGAGVAVRVSEWKIAGSLSEIGTAPPVALPAEAQKAAEVRAQG